MFDSGIGGISILNQLIHLPIQEFLYFADTVHLPYGEKSVTFLKNRAVEITHYFIKHNIDTIVIACHTSSTAALDHLQKTFPNITFIDMLMPTITAALKVTKTNTIGVMATERSIASHMHKRLLQQKNTHITVIEQACPDLVPLLETSAHTLSVEKAIDSYTAYFKNTNIDTLILGCTHYAFLEKAIAQKLPGIQLISAAQTIAHQALMQSPCITYVTTGDSTTFKNLLARYSTCTTYQVKKEIL